MDDTITIDRLVRSNIRKVSSYKSARDKYLSGTLLDANENSFGAPFKDTRSLHRYPSPKQELLRDKYAEFRAIRKENVFVGTGSDEAIDLLFTIFCNPGEDRIIVTPPTYGMYEVTAGIHDIAVDEAPLTESYQLDRKSIKKALTDNTKLLFLCSPNNPTGNEFAVEDIEWVIDTCPGIVVLDEAYIDFSERASFCRRIAEYPNLVVLQTLSKSFGLAGIRLGAALACEPIIQYMLKVKAPYNVNRLTSEFGLKALANLDRVQFSIDKIIEERERLSSALSMLDSINRVYQSSANFILFDIQNAEEVHRKLAENEVIVRYRGGLVNCDNCLRVTVGTPEENDLFLSTLKEVTS